MRSGDAFGRSVVGGRCTVAVVVVALVSLTAACGRPQPKQEDRATVEREARAVLERMRAAQASDERLGNGRRALPPPATEAERLRREEDEARRRDGEEAVLRQRRAEEEAEQRRRWAALPPAQRRAAERAAEEARQAQRRAHAEGLDRAFIRDGVEVRRVEARGTVLYVEYIGCGRVFLDRTFGDEGSRAGLRLLGFASIRCNNGLTEYWDQDL